MARINKDGSINQSIINSSRRRKSFIDNNGDRVISARQLMILFYHFYLMLNDNDICGFMDCDKTAAQFQNEMDQDIRLSQEVLEKLLYMLQVAYENDLYWNPAGDDIESFIKSLLVKNEKFDKLSCLISKK